MKNCEVTEDDVKRMFDIWVADVEAIKGKNTRKTPDRVKTSIVALPAEILEKNKIVTLDIDIFFTNKIPFLLSLSQAIILNTVQHLTDRTKNSLLAAITLICNLYYRRGFLVKYINADNEFTHLKPEILTIGIYMNICAANEHIPAIERRIRVFKERHRAIRHGLPYACIPRLMVIELNNYIAHFLNAFQAK